MKAAPGKKRQWMAVLTTSLILAIQTSNGLQDVNRVNHGVMFRAIQEVVPVAGVWRHTWFFEIPKDLERNNAGFMDSVVSSATDRLNILQGNDTRWEDPDHIIRANREKSVGKDTWFASCLKAVEEQEHARIAGWNVELGKHEKSVPKTFIEPGGLNWNLQ